MKMGCKKFKISPFEINTVLCKKFLKNLYVFKNL